MTSRRDATDSQPQSVKPVGGINNARASVDSAAYNGLFVSMVLGMSWQLALAVIVPIIGGYLLDQHFGSSPWLVLSGLAVAVLATCGILWRTVQEANRRVATLEPKGGKK